MPIDREYGLAAQQPCYVCQARTHRVCDRCKRPICVDHTTSHVQMHWESWHGGGDRAGGYWTRYLPSGALLKVCPACKVALNAKDALELARDRRSVCENVLLYGVVVVGGLAALIGLPFLLGHFVCH